MWNFSNTAFSVQKFFQAPANRSEGSINASQESNDRTRENIRNIEAQRRLLEEKIKKTQTEQIRTHKSLTETQKNLQSISFTISDLEEELPSIQSAEQSSINELQTVTANLNQTVQATKRQTAVLRSAQAQYAKIKNENNPEATKAAYSMVVTHRNLLDTHRKKVTDLIKQQAAKLEAMRSATKLRQESEAQLAESQEEKQHLEEMEKNFRSTFNQQSIMLEDFSHKREQLSWEKNVRIQEQQNANAQQIQQNQQEVKQQVEALQWKQTEQSNENSQTEIKAQAARFIKEAYENNDLNAKKVIVAHLTRKEQEEFGDKSTSEERRKELAELGARRAAEREQTQKNAQEVKVEAEDKAAENKGLREANAALNLSKAKTETSDDNSTENGAQKRNTNKNETTWERASTSVSSKTRPITEMEKPVETTVSEEWDNTWETHKVAWTQKTESRIPKDAPTSEQTTEHQESSPKKPQAQSSEVKGDWSPKASQTQNVSWNLETDIPVSSVEQNGEDEAMIWEVQKITPSGNSAQSSMDSESVRKIWDNVQKNGENKNPSPRSNPKERGQRVNKPISAQLKAKRESTTMVQEHTQATMEDLMDTMKETGFFTKERFALLNPRDAQAIAELMAFKDQIKENKSQKPNNTEQTQSNNEQTEKIRESTDEQSDEQSGEGEKVQVENEARQVDENFRDAMREGRKTAEIIAKAQDAIFRTYIRDLYEGSIGTRAGNEVLKNFIRQSNPDLPVPDEEFYASKNSHQILATIEKMNNIDQWSMQELFMQNLPPKAGSFSDQALKNKAFAPIIVALGSAQNNMSEVTSSNGSVAQYIRQTLDTARDLDWRDNPSKEDKRDSFEKALSGFDRLREESGNKSFQEVFGIRAYRLANGEKVNVATAPITSVKDAFTILENGDALMMAKLRPDQDQVIVQKDFKSWFLTFNIFGHKFTQRLDGRHGPEYWKVFNNMAANPLLAHILRGGQEMSLNYFEKKFSEKYPTEKIGTKPEKFYQVLFEELANATGNEDLRPRDESDVRRIMTRMSNPIFYRPVETAMRQKWILDNAGKITESSILHAQERQVQEKKSTTNEKGNSKSPNSENPENSQAQKPE